MVEFPAYQGRVVHIYNAKGAGMYDREAHEQACKAAIKQMEVSQNVRVGGKPYEADDQYIFLNARCSEIVIDALQPLCPLKWDRLADVTMGLGAGFSNMGEVCGLVVGGIIAIGLDLSARYRDTVALRYYTIKFTQKFMRDCAKEFGSLRCRDLLGHDISGTLIPGDETYATFIRETMKARAAGQEGICPRIQRWVLMYPLPSEQEELHPPLI